MDRRFDKDPEFPNQWRSMKKDDDGNTVFGPPQPYHGAYYYMKMTRLHDPKDAILIEGHVIFNEPKGWFEGENALGFEAASGTAGPDPGPAPRIPQAQ